jgi:hypothetical protein
MSCVDKKQSYSDDDEDYDDEENNNDDNKNVSIANHYLDDINTIGTIIVGLADTTNVLSNETKVDKKEGSSTEIPSNDIPSTFNVYTGTRRFHYDEWRDTLSGAITEKQTKQTKKVISKYESILLYLLLFFIIAHSYDACDNHRKLRRK